MLRIADNEIVSVRPLSRVRNSARHDEGDRRAVYVVLGAQGRWMNWSASNWSSCVR